MRRSPACYAAAAVLGVHAAYAIRFGVLTTGLPLEAGGLFFTTLIGLPMLAAGAVFVVLAAVAVFPSLSPRARLAPAGGLAVIALFDVLFLGNGGRSGIVVLSLLAAAGTATATILTELRPTGR